MNRLIKILFAIVLFTIPLLCSADSYQVQCSPQLQSSFNKIQKIPEARELIQRILKEGPLRIMVRNTSLSRQFGAFWDRDARAICIACPENVQESDVIGSILFELHNASINSKFDEIDNLAIRRKINRATYIEKMEHLEYINSLNTAKLAEKGIQMGVIPHGSRLHTYSSFEEHFSVQKESGHSDCFAQCYDDLISSS